MRRQRPRSSNDPTVYREFNRDVSKWGSNSRTQLKRSLKQHNIGQSGELERKLRQRTFKRNGIAERVRFQLERYGIYRSKGVGKGGKVGSLAARRMQADWFNQVMATRISLLADIASEHHADINGDKIFIK